MTFVDPTSALGGLAGTTSGASGLTGTTGQRPGGVNQLDNSQTFLELLVAQLKNQNPDNPTDPTSFMTEIAQLTAVQSQTSLNAEEQTVAADSMIGQSITGNGTNGRQVSGTVTGVVLSSSGPPQLQISTGTATGTGTTAPGLTTISLDAVTRVYTASSPVPTSGSPSSTGTTSPGTASAAGTSTTSTTSSTPTTTTA